MQSPEHGRAPVAYRPEFAEEARKLALIGVTDQELASHFQIPLATLDQWRATVPEFARGILYGRSLGDAEVVDRLHQSATGIFRDVVNTPVGMEGEPPPAIRRRSPSRAALNFWLANRRPVEWLEMVEAESRLADARKLTDSELSQLVTECVGPRGSTRGG